MGAEGEREWGRECQRRKTVGGRGGEEGRKRALRNVRSRTCTCCSGQPVYRPRPTQCRHLTAPLPPPSASEYHSSVSVFCLSLSLSLSVTVSVSVSLSFVSVSLSLSVSVSVCLSVCLSVSLSLMLKKSLLIHSFIHDASLCVFISVLGLCLSVCLSVSFSLITLTFFR